MGRVLGSLHWRLLLAVNVLVATISGVLGVLLFVAPRWFGDTASTEYDLVLAAARDYSLIQAGAIAGLVVVSGNLLWLVYGRAPRIPMDHVVSVAPDGPVRVSREAIESRLRGAGEELEHVTRLRISLEAAGPKRILILAVSLAPDGVSIQTTSQSLRTTLDRTFRSLVNLAEGSRFSIDIEFASFAGKISKKDGQSPEPSPAEESFTGPKYPIDEDDESPES